MEHCILTAEHIQKKYGNQAVLCDLAIRIKQGEIYGLIGKNGSGKTTLFRILTGLIQEYSGNVFIGDINNRKAKVSAVINSPSLFLNMNAFQNMKEQAYVLGINGENEIRQALKTVGLADCGKKLVKNFSLGMTQRLKLAMALLESPDILILDEPANGLDPDGIAELRELLIHLNRFNKITILISSHILCELEQLVTCLGILHDRKIVKELSSNDILQSGTNLEKLYMQYTKGGNGDA